MAGVIGGQKLAARLKEIAAAMDSASTVRVGFLEGATFPDGTSIPMVAAELEFGGTISMPAHDQVVYRKVLKNGEFSRKGKFVKQRISNFSTTHHVDAYTITIPPRPFFRTMIRNGQSHWGGDMAKILKANKYDTAKSLALLGNQIGGELQQSIKDTSDPANAKSTIAKKGFDQPLIDKGTMWKSVDFEVLK